MHAAKERGDGRHQKEWVREGGNLGSKTPSTMYCYNVVAPPAKPPRPAAAELAMQRCCHSIPICLAACGPLRASTRQQAASQQAAIDRMSDTRVPVLYPSQPSFAIGPNIILPNYYKLDSCCTGTAVPVLYGCTVLYPQCIV